MSSTAVEGCAVFTIHQSADPASACLHEHKYPQQPTGCSHIGELRGCQRRDHLKQCLPALLQDIVIKKGEQEGVGGVTIGRIPLMLRSDRCVLKGKSEDELARLGERFACVAVLHCVLECTPNPECY